MDAEDASPFNPFHYWKERLRSDETEEGVEEGSHQDLGHGVGGSDDHVVSAAQEESSAFHGATKRRPPPLPPVGQISRSNLVPKSHSPLAEQGPCTLHGPSGLQERSGKLTEQSSTSVQERLEKLIKPSSKDTVQLRRIGGLGSKDLESGQLNASVQGKRGKLSSKVANLQTSAAAGQDRESQSGRDAAGVQERINRLEAGSDADSYMPTFKKPPMKSPVPLPGHTPGHKAVKKTTSNPLISADGGSSRRVLHHIKSSGSLESGGKPPTPTTKFIPTIQTIRASTGDQLSEEDLDLELYRPQRGGSSHQSGKVLDVAKKIDSVLLGAKLSMVGMRGRGSGGELPVRSRSGSSGDVKSSDGVS